MDMSNINSQGTPYNMNEPYSNKLIIIIISVIAFLSIRNLFIYLYNKTKTLLCLRSLFNILSPYTSFFGKIENYVINKFSYRVIHSTICPPLGGILVILVLISACLPLLLLNVNLTLNSNRAGFLALAIVPFLLSSTGKNSAIFLLTGISNSKLNFLHRILGMALFLCATIHMSCMLSSWSRFPDFMNDQLKIPKVRYGLAGYVCLCIVMLGSWFPIRKYCYELFMVSHLLGIAFIGIIAVHTPYAMRYFISGLICYGLNLVAVWFVKTYVAVARFKILPEGCTKVSIRLVSPISKHSIGQYVYLSIPAISLFQWHPFTITSIHGNEVNTTIEVCICARGNFTRRLYKTIDPSQELRVFVSGPFGSQQIETTQILNSYPSLVIACGGAGITFGIRLLRELTETLLSSDIEENDSSTGILFNHWKTQNIYFYWSVRRPLEFEWFKEELEQLYYLYETRHDLPSLCIKFYCTLRDTATVHSTTGRFTNNNTVNISHIYMNETMMNDNLITVKENKEEEENHNHTTTKDYLGKEIEIIQGKRLQAETILSVDNNIGAFVCGPTNFNATFRNTVAMKKPSTVYLHCEDFAY
ncbi:FAD-binding domain-containing protein [Cokeromyces recurvatus]|uniref:FAD-binding domain-containing protein n=1 Tax=Cokeromyces recurvatus TaxID=90255 RepID=UPI00221E47E3|nr:FAD-binding domain-containing protein [Cokeromyces recurvatus]KAI7908248.1 FAD-binding domain-containing protein [Cokeromyces recurvatus]